MDVFRLTAERINIVTDLTNEIGKPGGVVSHQCSSRVVISLLNV